VSIESALYMHLTNDARVAALVSTRIYPLLIPADATMPAVAYQVIDDVPSYAHEGATGLSRARIQLTMQGSYSQLVALRYALMGAVHAFSGDGSLDVQMRQVEAARDGYAETLERAVKRMDVIFWYYDRSLI
jgi:hypothetical protein